MRSKSNATKWKYKVLDNIKYFFYYVYFLIKSITFKEIVDVCIFFIIFIVILISTVIIYYHLVLSAYKSYFGFSEVFIAIFLPLNALIWADSMNKVARKKISHKEIVIDIGPLHGISLNFLVLFSLLIPAILTISIAFLGVFIVSSMYLVYIAFFGIVYSNAAPIVLFFVLINRIIDNYNSGGG